MKKITNIVPLVNILGAVVTYIYFRFILDSGTDLENIPAYYSPLFFMIGTACLIICFQVTTRGSKKTLFDIAYGKTKLSTLDDSEIHHLQREALQFPIITSVITLLVWILAGFIFGFLEPIITAKIFNIETPGLIYCLRRFLGISLLGGGITTLIFYFIFESAWRNYIPNFFPQGHLSHVKHVFKLSVQKRLLIVFLSISIIPLPMLGLTTYSKVMALHMADALSRAQIINSLIGEFAFIVADSLAICLILAYFLSKSISQPLLRIKNAIKEVENNNLDVQTEIISNDELGDVAEGFNLMIKAMKKSRNIQESFGKYVCKEIQDEIVAGKTTLEGEMKRVTILFSDLRNFTTLVEKNHPKHVVAIMNQYFNEMTIAVKANRGIILQYVGDEIMAAFGAPVGFDDHPDMAVKAALGMRKRLDALNIQLEKQGFKPLAHGIGIHSGAVLAGNIGSEERMSYALVGDTVNSASRIEGLAKQYGCDIIISQTTFNLLTESYNTRPLDQVKVKGKENEIIIYQLL